MPTVVNRTIKSAGGDYTSCAAFLAGEQRNLVSADEIAQGTGFPMLDDGGDPIVTGWTLDSTHYVSFVASTPHGCVRGQGSRRRIWGFGHGFEFDQDFCRVDGWAIESDDNGGLNAPGDRGFHVDCGASSDIRISRMYHTVFLTNDQAFFRSFNASGGVKIWNCMASADLAESGSLAQAIDIASLGATYVYNNTVLGQNFGPGGYCIGNTSGGSPTIVCKNNIADRGVPVNGHGYDLGGATTTGSTNNLADSTDTSSPGSNPIQGDPVYVDETNGNLHIGASDSVCRNVGADLSADGNIPFSNDIDGDARPIGAAWDVGADESAPAVPPRGTLAQFDKDLRGTVAWW